MTEKVFRETVPKYMDLLMTDFGFSLEDAAAIMGNAGHESGGLTQFQEIKPTVAGSRGGYGWFQWTGPRRRDFESYVLRNNLDPESDKANYGWLWVELKGPEKAAVARTKAAIGLRDKVIAFEESFERSGVKAYDSRLKWAKIALNEYAKVKPGTGAHVAAPLPGLSEFRTDELVTELLKRASVKSVLVEYGE